MFEKSICRRSNGSSEVSVLLDNEQDNKTTQQKQHTHDHSSSINILSLNNLETGNPLVALLIVLLISAAIMIYKE